jgi:CBS domain-containing protein/sporulation protein YlmC with PRC-barrel domain
MLTSFFLNQIIHRNIYDEFDDFIGKLCDIYVTTEDGYPRAIGYKIKKGREVVDYEFRYINFFEENDRIVIKVRGVNEIIPRKFSYLLSKHLLNKKIVDINGKKVVKVDDLRMAKIAGELRVLAVDSGVLAAARRHGLEKIIETVYSILRRKPTDNVVLWESVQSLEMIKDNLQLSIPYEKLTRLHPADLADILEELDEEYRNKILESLDNELASEILQEIDPKIQGDILKTINEFKVTEILINMPSDEIADILEEVDEEKAEKILLNFEKEDEEEVRTLMEYEDNLVGSIMNKDFITFNINITVHETLEILRETKPDDEVSYYIYIVDEKEKLKGAISLRDLVVSSPYSKIIDIMESDITFVRDVDILDTAVESIIKYDLTALPVVDEHEKLCGIVIINDIIEEVLSATWKKKLKKVV